MMGIVALFASGINFGALLAVVAVVIGISVRVALLEKQGKTIFGAQSAEKPPETNPNKAH
jgi:hypothetical protein